jgi:alpha-methylacyl-CoA racemase
MAGPLEGIRIVEMAGIGPAPFAGMMLADHGAEIIRVERPGGGNPKDVLNRSRLIVEADLKTPEGVQRVRDLASGADGLIEGFRPGVMERLGLGPDVLLEANKRLVYGRMTGWGQQGPYAQAAGHDINYIAVAGALHAFGRAGNKPTPPANLVGDFGGGGMSLAFGMVCALFSAATTGNGQVIDCAMVDGAALLMSMIWSFRASGDWQDERGVNLLDTGAPFYDTYETRDGKYIAVGAIEPQFYKLLRFSVGLQDDSDFDRQLDRASWPHIKHKLTEVFLMRTRDEWCAIMEYSDACFAPVLSMEEAAVHPHNAQRRTFIELEGVIQPAPAPRYSLTPCATPSLPRRLDQR